MNEQDVLERFTNENGDVIESLDAGILKSITTVAKVQAFEEIDHPKMKAKILVADQSGVVQLTSFMELKPLEPGTAIIFAGKKYEKPGTPGFTITLFGLTVLPQVPAHLKSDNGNSLKHFSGPSTYGEAVELIQKSSSKKVH